MSNPKSPIAPDLPYPNNPASYPAAPPSQLPAIPPVTITGDPLPSWPRPSQPNGAPPSKKR